MGGPGRGRDDDDLHGEAPAFSDEGMRRIVYGEDRRMIEEALQGRAPDSHSRAFDDDTAELEEDLRSRRSLVPVVTALAAVFCFAAIVWYAYTWGTGQMTGEDLPVVRAEPMPEKVRPAQPGGMDVPHQGIAVLNEGGEGTGNQEVERLLPRPEIPAPPPPLPPEASTPSVTAQLPQEDEIPLPPLIDDSSDADMTAPPELDPEFAESDGAGEAGPTELAEGGILKPVPKPPVGEAAQDDQIARLLEEQPLETANGGSDIPAPPAAEAPAPAATQTATQTAPQTAAVTAGDVVLQLSSVKSEAAAQQEWQRLTAAHPGLLGSLPLTLERAEVQGTTYFRVQTGPFASRSAAGEVCSQLKARQQDCLVKQR